MKNSQTRVGWFHFFLELEKVLRFQSELSKNCHFNNFSKIWDKSFFKVSNIIFLKELLFLLQPIILWKYRNSDF